MKIEKIVNNALTFKNNNNNNNNNNNKIKKRAQVKHFYISKIQKNKKIKKIVNNALKQVELDDRNKLK